MLKKYKPSAALKAEDILRLTYEDAVNQANEAIGSQDWAKAIGLLKAAIRKADPARNTDKANHARYLLAFCNYKNNRFYEADVLAEHLARRYPQGGLSAQASEIAMQSLADAYNTYTEIDRMSDLDRLINLATYTVETWPDKEQADAARMNLSQIYFGMGRYDEAIKVLSSVRKRSQQWIPPRTDWAWCTGARAACSRAGRYGGYPGRSPEGDRFAERRPQGAPRCRHRPATDAA